MNKVAIITGGARRIGAETANYLHSKNIDITICIILIIGNIKRHTFIGCRTNTLCQIV